MWLADGLLRVAIFRKGEGGGEGGEGVGMEAGGGVCGGGWGEVKGGRLAREGVPLMLAA